MDFRTPKSPLRSSLAFVVMLFGLWPLACEGDPQLSSSRLKCADSRECDEGQFCRYDGACVAECSSCGKSCSSTENCPVGQFCDPIVGACQRECSKGENDCGSDASCSDDGECVDKGLEVEMGGASGDGDVNGECIDVQVQFEPKVPNVVLLIDQSGSMNEDGFVDAVDEAERAGSYQRWDCPDSPDGNSPQDGWDDDDAPDYAWRWNVVRNVLLHPETGIVKPLEDRVRFGLALYSSDVQKSDTCPLLTEVDVAFGSHRDMLKAFSCSDLLRDTPTRQSLTLVAEKLARTETEGAKVIVLATDGEPDTCECADWDADDGRPPECDNEREESLVEYEGKKYSPSEYEQIQLTLEAARIHEELGIIVEVINLGVPGLKPHLDSVAAYGGALGGESIDGTSPEDLTAAFEDIIEGVRSCAVSLDGKISSGKEDTGMVRLDTDPGEGTEFEALELDDEDGWVVRSRTEIELVGEACATIKEGDHDLEISFPCDAFVVNPR